MTSVPMGIQLLIEYRDDEFPDFPHSICYQIVDYAPDFPYSRKLLNHHIEKGNVLTWSRIPQEIPVNLPEATHLSTVHRRH